MITLPGDIQQDPGWDGRTGFDKHLESDMDFEEHQRIAFDANDSVTLVGFGDPSTLHASDFKFA